MNNIIDNFAQILEFAKGYGIPQTKKRGILREYLQTKILELVYQTTQSVNLFFVGGTSLRLLHNLDRFSEDLDFDLKNISFLQIDELMKEVSGRLKKENIELDFYRNQTAKRLYFEFRFKNLLNLLKITAEREEKLVVKFDFENFWHGHKRKTVLLKKYGFLANIVTIPLEQILVQKLFAYIKRKQTLPRDIYDLVWLYSREVKPDWDFVKKNYLPPNLLAQAFKKFEKEKRKLPDYKLKLRPFLLNEENVEKMDLLGQILEQF